MMGKVGFSQKMRMPGDALAAAGALAASAVPSLGLVSIRRGLLSNFEPIRAAHEARPLPSHAPERGHSAHGRADEPLGRDERQVG